MNTLMWEHPLTLRHLRQLASDAGAVPPAEVDLEALPGWINAHCPRLKIAAPESRRLACGDVGVGAMAAVEAIVERVAGCAGSNSSPTGPTAPRSQGALRDVAPQGALRDPGLGNPTPSG
jgi:phosphopantothenoylcysteine synthetase/decarboxylase